MARSESYDDLLMEMLADPVRAEAYISAAREDGDPMMLEIAQRNVAAVEERK
jgi:hypothetical protein